MLLRSFLHAVLEIDSSLEMMTGTEPTLYSRHKLLALEARIVRFTLVGLEHMSTHVARSFGLCV